MNLITLAQLETDLSTPGYLIDFIEILENRDKVKRISEIEVLLEALKNEL